MSAAPSRPSVAVIGAGFGGIAAAVRLRRAGITDVTVFERSPAVGGTWWDNHYPGAETDAPSHLYCYSFLTHDWTRTHVRQPELRAYLHRVIDSFALGPSLRLGAAVEAVTWDEDGQRWQVRTADGAERPFTAVVSAVGLFGTPRRPAWPGLDGFRGPVIHTAAWDDTVDLTGRRVGVVGTGSSAAQVVPALAPHVAHLTLFQRQPGWLLPKRDRDFTPWERAVYRRPLAQRLHRARLYLGQESREWHGALFKPGTGPNTRAREAALRYLAEVFGDRPDLRRALTPDYPFAGKRAVLSSDFFPALRRDNVRLVPRAVISCTADGVVDAGGEEHRLDALVLATGFEATRYLASLRVIGRGGRSLHEVWADEPRACLGITMPGFPNFFMLYGPNTNGGLIISNLERQAAFATAEIVRAARTGRPAEPTAAFTAAYDRWVQRAIAGMAYASSANYYTTASGRVVTQWPYGAALYAALTFALRRPSTWRVPARRPTGGSRRGRGRPSPRG